MTSSPSTNKLFSDMLFEILSRTTSLKALDTCKVVSKEWQQLLGESAFIRTTSARAKIICGFILQDVQDGRFASRFVAMDRTEALPRNIPLDNGRDYVKILASCNQGILCCELDVVENSRIKQYYVCKPATGQCMYVPNPVMKNRDFYAAAIVVMQSTDYLGYKIVRLTRSNDFRRKYNGTTRYGVEIFDSKDWNWSITEELVLPGDDFIRSDPAVSIGNTVYWRLSKLGRDIGDVLSFCLDDYSFDRLSLPEYSHVDELQLVEYNGKLGFTRLTEQGEMEVWQLSNPSNKEWTRNIVLNLQNLEDYCFLKPAGFYNPDIAIFKKLGGVVFYKIQDGSYSEVKVEGLYDTGSSGHVFQFRSDLEAVNFRPPWLPASVKSNVSLQAKKTKIVLKNNYLLSK